MRQSQATVSSASNEARNLYVVRQITDAILELMKHNQLRDLSISQICQEAGVGRASFYRNFESKEDVLQKYLKSLTTEWAVQHEGIDQADLVEAIFDHYYKHREVFILLYQQELAHICLQNISEACGPKPEQSNIDAYAAAFLSYGIFGWIEEWFRRGVQESPKEMAQLCLKSQQRNTPK